MCEACRTLACPPAERWRQMKGGGSREPGDTVDKADASEVVEASREADDWGHSGRRSSVPKRRSCGGGAEGACGGGRGAAAERGRRRGGRRRLGSLRAALKRPEASFLRMREGGGAGARSEAEGARAGAGAMARGRRRERRRDRGDGEDATLTPHSRRPGPQGDRASCQCVTYGTGTSTGPTTSMLSNLVFVRYCTTSMVAALGSPYSLKSSGPVTPL